MTPETVDSKNILPCKLAVIGAGMAGIAAAVFAANRNIPTVQVGRVSEIGFSSGCLDLFATLPHPEVRSEYSQGEHTCSGSTQAFDHPFEGIEHLVKAYPSHPYARLTRQEIETGFDEFMQFMAGAGIEYHCGTDTNPRIITPAGTLKSTWCVPSFMQEGSRAIEEKKRILIVDIKGLKGFGALQIAQNLKKILPGVQGKTITFPGRETSGDLHCEHLGRDLENPGLFDRFAQTLMPHVKDVDVVGLPAILGIYRFDAARHKLEQVIGKKVFEIPTLAPSVTGMRIKEASLSRLPQLGVTGFSSLVKQIDMDSDGDFMFNVTRGLETVTVKAKYLLIATGRFMGRGLVVEDGIIREQLMGLPVYQPRNRSQWFHRDFFHAQGHPINRAGVETDACFRPLDIRGKVFHPRLFTAGSLIAHQDWKREKSGAGVSIASAIKAVATIAEQG
ncbi:MAG: anaerobic glycerol-3-phosphate dehydrogenase subunit B [Desulfobacteraceae bacterium]|nr:MAG: anaerobic glycerol-3-phosphate dehydrogenase subunit B [Desulfobacteraceae bacterium]